MVIYHLKMRCQIKNQQKINKKFAFDRKWCISLMWATKVSHTNKTSK